MKALAVIKAIQDRLAATGEKDLDLIINTGSSLLPIKFVNVSILEQGGKEESMVLYTHFIETSGEKPSMSVYGIWRDSMGGSGWQGNTFFLDKRVAADKVPPSVEWTDYSVRPAMVSTSSFGTVELAGKVFHLDKTDGEIVVKRNALAKLTAAEKKALNINE